MLTVRSSIISDAETGFVNCGYFALAALLLKPENAFFGVKFTSSEKTGNANDISNNVKTIFFILFPP